MCENDALPDIDHGIHVYRCAHQKRGSGGDEGELQKEHGKVTLLLARLYEVKYVETEIELCHVLKCTIQVYVKDWMCKTVLD